MKQQADPSFNGTFLIQSKSQNLLPALNAIKMFSLLFGVYAVIYLIVTPWIGTGTGILVTIPVLIVAWTAGGRYGLIAWLIGAGLNIALSTLDGYPWQTALTDGTGLGTGVLCLVMLGVAHMRNIGLRLTQELAKRQQSEAELEVLYNATSQLFQADDLLSLGEQIVQAVAQEFKQIDCGLLLSVTQSKSIIRLARTGQYRAMPDQPLHLDGAGLVPEVMRSSRMIYAPDVDNDPRYVANVASTRSELVIPLQTAKGVIGVLDLQSPQVDGFDTHTQGMLTAYAKQAAVAIETQLLNDELQHHAGELEWRVLQRTAELQKAKEQIEAILTNSSDTIVLVSPEGIIQRVNPAFTTLSGYTPEEACGQSLCMLSANEAELQEAIDQVKQDNQVVHLDMQIRRSNNILVDVDMMLSSIHDEDGQITGIVYNIRDITERKRAIEAIRQSQAQLQAIMDNTQAIIYVKDLEGRYLLINRQFEKDFKVTRDELQGKVDYDIFAPKIAHAFHTHDLQVLERGEPMVFEEEVIKQQQKHIYLSNKFPVIDAGGNLYGVCGVSTDITTQKQIEDSLRVALVREQELNALKTNFISMVSHEFRTPLTVIGTSSETLLAYYKRLSPEKRQQKLKQIQHQVGRLTHLMNEVLILSQADSVGLPFKPAAVQVLELCQSIIEDVTTADRKDVHIDFVQQDIDGFYLIDEHLFRHIFQNLLSNAIKYSNEQSIISIQVSVSSGNLKLLVRDQGIGIPEAQQRHLFSSFHRASNVGDIPGTGLGLAIVKRAVEEHNGNIDFKSKVDEGTIFVVTLPTEKMTGASINR